jgi:hypothetical protein
MRDFYNIRTSSILILITILAFSRLIPHPPNFTPLLGMAVFSGVIFDRKILAFVAPLMAMLISDLVIGFHSSMPIIYFAITLNVGVGFLLVSKFSYLKSILALVSGALIFFILTNFSVWLGSGMYSQDLNGLISCYIMALPFFQNTLLSSLVYGLGAFYLFDLFENKFLKTT